MLALRLTAALVFCLFLGLTIGRARGQNQPDAGADKDKTEFLIARPEMGDPIFNQAVVALFPASVVASDRGERIVMGLVVNRPARFALSEFFPDDKAFKDRSETAYFGGPVDMHSFCALFRSSKEFKQAVRLFSDVQVTFDSNFIAQHLKKPGDIRDLRLFLGRAQWSPAQLQNEVDLGAWYKVPAETNLIFTPTPQDLWHTLLDRAAPGPIVQRFKDSAGIAANKES
jgi:putative transcriptional regulator